MEHLKMTWNTHGKPLINKIQKTLNVKKKGIES